MGCFGGTATQEGANRSALAKSQSKPGKPAKCEAVAKLERQDDLELYQEPDPVQTQQQIQWPFADPPLCGLEIECNDVQIISMSLMKKTSGISGIFWKKLNEKGFHLDEVPEQLTGAFNSLRAVNDLQERRYHALKKLGEACKKLPNYPKRHAVFSAPHGSWAGTIDSVGDFAGRLEVVTAPISDQAWRSNEVREDLTALAELEQALEILPKYALFPIKGLHLMVPQLRVHEGDAYVIVPPKIKYDFQMTRQIPIAEITGAKKKLSDFPKEVGLPGVQPDGIQLVIDTIRLFENPNFSGNNPKETFENMLKSPLDKVLGKADPQPDDKAIDGWVEGVAHLAGISGRLESDPIAKIKSVMASKQKKRDMEPRAAGFTWKQFLTSLLVSHDDMLASMWSRTAFGGEEDFGYGTLPDARLLPGNAIFEFRKPGSVDSGVVAKVELCLEKWRGELAAPADDEKPENEAVKWLVQE